jgi:hypothetical protein
VFSRRPDIWFCIAVLVFVVAVNALVTDGVPLMLSWVLAGLTVRFATLPDPVNAPHRRTGSLLIAPLIVGLAFLFLSEVGGGTTLDGRRVQKTRDGHHIQPCGVMLISCWVILCVWDLRRNRRLDLEEASIAAAEAEAASR